MVKNANHSNPAEELKSKESRLTTPLPVEEGGDEYFANLFLLFFGSGTFALPWGFARAGLLGGTAGVVIVGIITWLTISMLVKSKRIQQGRLLLLSPLLRRDSMNRNASALSSPGSVRLGVQNSLNSGGGVGSAADEAARSEALQRSLTYAAIASHAFGTPLAGRVVKVRVCEIP